jgi:putative tricarboxylic transport membrane protein
MDYLFSVVGSVLTWPSLTAILVGTLFGLIFGILPGLGSVLAISIALPFTFTMDQVSSISLMLAIYCSSVYGGSLSAILINTPGTPQSATTMFDGYPMTKQGKADLAIGWTTGASLFGGLFSVIVLIFAAPPLAKFALKFGPIETFALICMALTCIAGVSEGSLVKGLLAGVIGLFLSVIGTDTMTGSVRFEYGVFELAAGVELIPVLVGVFALTEVFWRLAEKATGVPAYAPKGSFRLAPLKEWLARWKTLIKSSVIGTLIGILPGTGAATASFVAYSEAKRSGRFREGFGKGEPEGIVASEASNNAVTGGALVPTLALGIPGDPVTAVMMSALIIQGIQPGVRLFADHGPLMHSVFFALIVCNIAMFIGGAFAARFVTKILKIPEVLLLSMVLILSLLGAFSVSGRVFDLVVALVAGLFGFVLRLAKVPLAPVVIGLVLGPIFEESLRQGLIIKDGNFLGFFGFSHPIAIVLMGVTGLIIFSVGRKEIRSLLSKKP